MNILTSFHYAVSPTGQQIKVPETNSQSWYEKYALFPYILFNGESKCVLLPSSGGLS